MTTSKELRREGFIEGHKAAIAELRNLGTDVLIDALDGVFIGDSAKAIADLVPPAERVWEAKHNG